MTDIRPNPRPADDAIAKSKRILALVDAYTDRPDNVRRSELRSALMEEMLVVSPPDHQIAHLVRHLSDMAAEASPGENLHDRIAQLVIPAIKRGTVELAPASDPAALAFATRAPGGGDTARRDLARKLETQADFEEAESRGGAGFETRELMREAARELMRPALRHDMTVQTLAAAVRQLAYCLRRVGMRVDDDQTKGWAAKSAAGAVDLPRRMDLAGSPLRSDEAAHVDAEIEAPGPSPCIRGR